MRTIVVSVVIGFLMAACAAQVVSTSPRTVVILAQGGMKDAQPLADAECRKYGLLARWAGRTRNEFTFDCVQ